MTVPSHHAVDKSTNLDLAQTYDECYGGRAWITVGKSGESLWRTNSRGFSFSLLYLAALSQDALAGRKQ